VALHNYDRFKEEPYAEQYPIQPTTPVNPTIYRNPYSRNITPEPVRPTFQEAGNSVLDQKLNNVRRKISTRMQDKVLRERELNDRKMH